MALLYPATITTLSLVLVTCLSPVDAADPELICSSEPVEAAVGENVTLQCHLVAPLDATNMKVEWRHEGLNHTVDLHQDGRTSLFPDGLTTGNLSLKVSSVRLSDSGRYRCSFSSENLQDSCYVNLTVVLVGKASWTEQLHGSRDTIDANLLIGIIVTAFVVVIVCVMACCCTRKQTCGGNVSGVMGLMCGQMCAAVCMSV
ncbi:butyrophilin subfamily 3 member A2-like [Symphorus nematophorus]